MRISGIDWVNVRRPCESVLQVNVADMHRLRLLVGARSFRGNPNDGHTLVTQIYQMNNPVQDCGAEPTTMIAGLA